jgi:hypothetical protein
MAYREFCLKNGTERDAYLKKNYSSRSIWEPIRKVLDIKKGVQYECPAKNILWTKKWLPTVKDNWLFIGSFAASVVNPHLG